MEAAQATKEKMSPVFSLAASAAAAAPTAARMQFCTNEPTEAETRLRGFNSESTTLTSPSAWLSSTLQPGCSSASDETAVAQLVQRYYTSVLGRFMTPDPYRASAGASDPTSWNRYTYTRGDPVNFVDPLGEDLLAADDLGTCLELGGEDVSECEFGEDFVQAGPAPNPSRYALWSVFRININAFAVAALAANLQRTGKNAQIPTYLQFQSACWTIGVPGEGGLGGAGFVLHVTYQVLDQNGQAMSGPQLSTADIAETFYYQAGIFA